MNAEHLGRLIDAKIGEIQHMAHEAGPLMIGIMIGIVILLFDYGRRYGRSRAERSARANGPTVPVGRSAPSPAGNVPVVSRKVVARVGRLLVEIAETLAEDGPTIDDPPADEAFASLHDVMGALHDEFQHRPGFQSIECNVDRPREIVISSHEDSWGADVMRWAQRHAPTAPIRFVHLPRAPESTIHARAPRRCPKCHSLRSVPHFGSPDSFVRWKCERCGHLFGAVTPDDAPKSPPPVAARPPIGGPPTALQALQRMSESADDDASSSAQIYSGPTRNP